MIDSLPGHRTLASLQSEIHSLTQSAAANAQADLNFLHVDKEAFQQCPKISIDFAVMEHADADNEYRQE